MRFMLFVSAALIASPTFAEGEVHAPVAGAEVLEKRIPAFPHGTAALPSVGTFQVYTPNSATNAVSAQAGALTGNTVSNIGNAGVSSAPVGNSTLMGQSINGADVLRR